MTKTAVIVPIHNEEKYVEESLLSVLNQETDYQFDIFCVFNNSTDNSKSIIESLKLNHTNGNCIKIYEQNLYKGTTPTRNYGLLQVDDSYTYIANQDADDVWIDKNKLQKQIKFLELNSDIEVVGGQYVGRTKHGPRDKTFKLEKRPLDHDDCLDAFINGINPVGNASAVYRRSILYKIGMYEDLLPLTEDMWFWYKAILAGFKISNLDDELVLYNVSSNPNYSPAYPMFLKEVFGHLVRFKNQKR
jgi:glycosyltransferase involved in cell wall biosynthesis